jgi:hypothetical protein
MMNLISKGVTKTSIIGQNQKLMAFRAQNGLKKQPQRIY